MVKPEGHRTIQCLHCRGRFEVSVGAISVPCPKCFKTSSVEDFILKKNKAKLLMLSSVRTCGRIVIPKGARLVSDLVEAHEGIEVHGHLDAKRVISGRIAVIGKKGVWKGDLQAPGLIVEERAIIERGYFEIPADPLGLSTLPSALPEPGKKTAAARKTRARVKKKPEPEATAKPVAKPRRKVVRKTRRKPPE